MSEQGRYTLQEAHKEFAKTSSGRVWALLERQNRSPAEAEELILAAHASLYHWLHVGSPVNAQRGHWLLARVCVSLEEAAPAVKHASRCLQLTEAHEAEMKDFDIAYAYEAMARAFALQGVSETSRKYHTMAAQAGEAIADPEDREIFVRDFEGGQWFGFA